MYREVKSKQKTLLNDEKELKTGVFSDFFDEFSLLNKKRVFLKQLFNKNALTEWQAIEVLGDDIFLIAAVFKFGIVNKTLMIVYDLNDKKLKNYSTTSLFKFKSKVAESLKNGSKSTRKTKNSGLEIINHLENGCLQVAGYAEELSFNISMKRISEPVVISLPMTKRHVVYTEKDFLQSDGVIHFQDKERELVNHLSILDDHRGYYPLSSGYDWFTAIGKIKIKGKVCDFAINLTAFYKCIDPDISENGYWINDKFYQLPDVKFHREGNVWYIEDRGKKLSLVFTVHDSYYHKKRRGLKIDYTLSFGEVSGQIELKDDTLLEIDSMFSLGEKRLTKLPLQNPYRD